MKPALKWFIIWLFAVTVIISSIFYFNNEWLTLLIPSTFPLIAIGQVKQWNSDFKNASYETKREMARILNLPDELY